MSKTETFLQAVRQNWAILCTIVALTVGGYVQLKQLDYRLTTLEQQVKEDRDETKAMLRNIYERLGKVDVNIAELVAIQKEQSKRK